MPLPPALLEAVASRDAGRLARDASAASLDDRRALVAALADASDAASLVALDAPGVPAPLRKEARRALHRLKSRGVAVPTVIRTGRLEAPAAAPAADPAEAHGWLVHDPPMAVLVLDAGSGARRVLCVGVLDGEERLAAGYSIPAASRHDLREFLRNAGRGGARPVEIAAGHAAARLHAALDRPLSPLGEAAREARDHLALGLESVGPVPEAPHPALSLLPAAAEDVDAEARRLIARLAPADLPVAMSEPQTRVLLQQLNTAVTGPLVITPGVRAEREQSVLREFAARELTTAQREALALRFLDRAWAVHAAGDVEAARGFACAGALLQREPAGPVAEALLLRYLLLHVRPRDPGEGAAPEETPRLVVSPDEFLAENRQRSGGGGSPRGGGLILP